MYKKALIAVIFGLLALCPLCSYALSFHTNTEYPGILLLTDEFVKGDFETFKYHLSKETDIDTIMLDSNGGNMMESLNIGFTIRESGLNTIITEDSKCYSACTYAFMGGVKRTIETGAPFAMHRPFFIKQLPGRYNDGYNSGIDVSIIVSTYLIEMGMDPLVAVLHLMNKDLAHFDITQQLELNIITATTEEGAIITDEGAIIFYRKTPKKV